MPTTQKPTAARGNPNGSPSGSGPAQSRTSQPVFEKSQKQLDFESNLKVEGTGNPNDDPKKSMIGDGAPRRFADIIFDMCQPIPEKYFKSKQDHGTTVNYVPWVTLWRFAMLYTKGHVWVEVMEEEEVRREIIDKESGVSTQKDAFLMIIRVWIRTSDCGIVYQDGDGMCMLDVQAYGDFQSNARATGLRRALSLYGLDLNSYERDSD